MVNEGDILLEIMSDKTNMELEAEDSGVLLKITRQAGETVPVTEVIGYIGAEGEVVADKAASAPAAEPTPKVEEVAAVAEPVVAAQTQAPIVHEGGKVRATPKARKLARELGIDLAQVPGTGAKGRVHADDVENFKGAQPKATPLARKIAADLGIDLASVSGTGFGGKITKEDILEISAPAQVKEAAAAPVVETKPEKVLPEGVEVIPMSAMRKAISKGMTHSYLTAPTFTLNYDVDMTNLMALRKQVLDPIMNKTGMKVTFTA